METSSGDSGNIDDPFGDLWAVTTLEVAWSVQRELVASDVCVMELYGTLSRRNRAQVIAIGFSLYQAWYRAQAEVAALEEASYHREAVARDALRHSREFARVPLAEAWALLLAGMGSATGQARNYD